MQKKIVVIISIIVLLVIIPIAIIGGIKYRNYVAEIEAVELPEIVFFHSVDKTDNTFATRIISRDGEVYYFEGNKTLEELIQLYHEKQMQDELQLIKNVEIYEVKKQYKLFCELVTEGQYEVLPPGALPDVIASRYTWYGYYYDSNRELKMKMIFEKHIKEYEVSDKRGKELADWITEALYD